MTKKRQSPNDTTAGRLAPKCCREYCQISNPDKCSHFNRCPAWRMWFAEKWREIQKYGKRTKEADK